MAAGGDDLVAFVLVDVRRGMVWEGDAGFRAQGQVPAIHDDGLIRDARKRHDVGPSHVGSEAGGHHHDGT